MEALKHYVNFCARVFVVRGLHLYRTRAQRGSIFNS